MQPQYRFEALLEGAPCDRGIANTINRSRQVAPPNLNRAARSYRSEPQSAHLGGRPDVATTLIALADLPAIQEWTESL
jgi:hypothetical protein